MGFGVFPPGRLHVKKHLAGKAARRSGVSHPCRVHGRKSSRFPAGWPRGRGRRSGLGCAPAHPHVWSPTAATATGTGRGSPPSEPRRPRGGSRRSPGSICRSAVSTALESVCPVQKAPPPSPSPAFLSSQGDTANPFGTPVTFLSWQQGRGAPMGEASRRAQPPAASAAALSSTALCRTKSTHSRGRRAARETSLWDNLNAHGERVPLFGSPFHQSQPGRKGGRLSAGISGLAHQSRSFIRPGTCQQCISRPRLFSNGGCHFSVRGAKRDLFGIQNIIFYGFWLYCCFDSIILLQELGAKAGDIFQSASLRKYHNKLSCQCGSCTCAKTCVLKWLWKMSKKGDAD